jgi:hypothetical protein
MFGIIVLLEDPWSTKEKASCTWDHFPLKNAVVVLLFHNPIDSIEVANSPIGKATPNHDTLVMFDSFNSALRVVALAILPPDLARGMISDLKFGLITVYLLS